jgi:S-DNA-T family DNA segregation ATPase FtsK/SpoIIIE
MPSTIAAKAAKNRDDESRPQRGSFFPPGRRRHELIGFLVGVAGLLLILSLISFQPLDPSLDTSTSSHLVHNWIGAAGALTADLLYQALGWTALLAPVALFILATGLILGRQVESWAAKAVGFGLLLVSSTSLLRMIPFTPLIRSTIPGGGLLGYLAAKGLVAVFNPLGAGITAFAIFLTSLFFLTRFSFSAAGRGLQSAAATLTGPLQRRYNAWREARERLKLQRRMARDRVLGKKPVGPRRPASPIPVPFAAPPASVHGAPLPALPAEMVIPEIVPRSTAPLETAGIEDGSAEIGAGSARAALHPRITGVSASTYKLPGTNLLRPPDDEQGIDEEELKERALQLTGKFNEFGVTGAVTQIHPGPVVTTFEFKPEAGIKYSRITNLVDDLCLAMRAESILIERIAGKSTVGIEVPNLNREIIYLREIIESSEFAGSSSRLAICLGKDITGKMKVGDLAQMPHLMIAGSTGSGKSVAINSLILSIIFKSTPDEVKLILIDPKRLELNLYDGIPHLFTPIVTEPKVAANVLRRATMEMEDRLKRLAQHGVRNIEQYNKLFEPGSTLDLFDTEGNQERPLPYLVIVIDELADLMMVEPQNVEESITRLAQMARAVGIHLILATQRPSVDVITGLIKANLPSRIAFRVASKVDSRTILDSNGAEALLGRGDMLFMPPASSRLVRLHGPLVSEKEINRVVDWWKAQSTPQYNEEFLKPVRDKERGGEEPGEEEDTAALDAVYEEAVRLIVESGKASTSLLQRRLRLGYGRAARLLDLMEKDGIISAPDGPRPREVLKRPDWLQEVDERLR